MNKTIVVLAGLAAVVMLAVMVAGRGEGDALEAPPPAAASAAPVSAVAVAAAPASAATVSEADFVKVLAAIAGRANATLPMMVDRNTRWDTTMGGPGRNITYFYSLPGHAASDVDPVATRDAITRQVTGNVCGNKDMQLMFKGGVTAHYVYRGNDGVEVVRLDIAPADCGVTPDASLDPQALLEAA